MNTVLLLNSVLCFVFAIINFTYYWVHANGKKHVRLYSSGILFIFSLLFLARFYGTIEQEVFWSVDWLIALIPVLDTIVDWKAKLKLKGR